MEGDELMDLAAAFDDVDGGEESNENEPSENGEEVVVENPDEEVIVEEPSDEESDVESDEDEESDVDASGKVSIPDEAKVVLVIDGKEVEHSFGEIRANAQKWAGAEKRFQEADTIRKDAEAKLAVLPQREQQLSQVLQYYIEQSQQYLQQEPDWDKLLAENPTEFLRTQHAWNARKAQQQQAQAIQAQLQKQQSEAEAASRQERLVSEQNKLLDAIPEWKDPQKAKDGSTKVLSYITQCGIPEEMLKEIDHHQVIVIARKAMLYDEAIAKQKAVRANGGRSTAQQVQQPTQRKVVRVERPGAGTPVAQPEVRNQLRKANAAKKFNSAPTVDNLASLFE